MKFCSRFAPENDLSAAKYYKLERKQIMKKFKSVIALILAAVLLFALAACNSSGTKPDETVTDAPTDNAGPTGKVVNVAAIKGPTGMGMVNLMSNPNYKFTLTGDPTEIVALISTGAVDIAACPLNLAANLFKKTGGNVQMIGVNTLGVLYVVTNGVEINSISDLKGKTVYLTGQGATPEFIVNDLLKKNGLEKDVKLEFLSEHDELAKKLITGDVQIAVLPEPFVSVATAKKPELKTVLNVTDEWSKVNPDAELAMGCVIARSDFIKKNPELVERFIADNKSSVEFVNTKALEASQKIVDAGILDAAAFAVDESLSGAKAERAKQDKADALISRCNIVFIDGEQMKTIASANLKVYFDADAKSVGGEMPSDALYYAKAN